jgi:hypothetical protein
VGRQNNYRGFAVVTLLETVLGCGKWYCGPDGRIKTIIKLLPMSLLAAVAISLFPSPRNECFTYEQATTNETHLSIINLTSFKGTISHRQ